MTVAASETLRQGVGAGGEELPGARNLVRALCAALVVIGLGSRCAPLADEGGRLLRQFPTEDGYLMLTMARNIALGRGMSVSDGTIQTNGTQPLMTFIYAAGFWLAGGDREGGVLAVHLISIVCSVGAAWMLYGLGRSLLGDGERERRIAAVAACLWFAAPLQLQHTMNMLETGAYAMMVFGSVWLFARWWRERARWSGAVCIGLGTVLGLTFLVRNDAVFLILGACLTRCLCGWRAGRAAVLRRVGETLVFGAISVAVAMPWLLYNVANFGHVMPISGLTESQMGDRGSNLLQLPSHLLEFATVVGAVPGSIETRPAVIVAGIAAALFAAAVAAVAWTRSRAGGAERGAIGVLAVMATGLLVYYGVYFGAAWFLSRYLMPLSGPLAIAAVLGAERIVGPRWGRIRGPVLGAASMAALLVALGLNVRRYGSGTDHMHFQVLEWVQEHVPAETWVGAPQTGTLGFFHDRTINFDGKVNPAALRAGRQGRTIEYVVESPVQYIADWQAVGNWTNNELIRTNFSLIVSEADLGSPLESRRRGLAVFRRKPEPAAIGALTREPR